LWLLLLLLVVVVRIDGMSPVGPRVGREAGMFTIVACSFIARTTY